MQPVLRTYFPVSPANGSSLSRMDSWFDRCLARMARARDGHDDRQLRRFRSGQTKISFHVEAELPGRGGKGC